ncbi:unnamed protein product [Parajaminaea phylloscopi]
MTELRWCCSLVGPPRFGRSRGGRWRRRERETAAIGELPRGLHTAGQHRTDVASATVRSGLPSTLYIAYTTSSAVWVCLGHELASSLPPAPY